MGLTPEQFRQMEERLERNKRPKSPAPVAPAAPVPEPARIAPILFVQPEGFWVKDIFFKGAPIGKPRMTRRDQFVKRPRVMRYWDFKDRLRVAAGTIPANPDMMIITAMIPMPKSWSKKKKAQMNGKPCRRPPDWDNVGKAVCDSLFDEDCCIWVGSTVKYWCLLGEERLEIKVLYAKQ